MAIDVGVLDKSRIGRVITESDRSYLNCLKGLLILLVVIGHFGNTIANLLPENTVFIGQGIIVFIYIFHMPLFLFVSGFLSKNVEKRRQRAFSDIFMPYLCFQTIISVCMLLVAKSGDIKNPLAPHMGLWYLLTLFCYRLVLPELSKVRGVLFISFLLSVFTCLFSAVSNEFALKRTFGFLIYFLAGYYASSIRITINKFVASISLIVACAVVILVTKKIDYGILQSILTRYAMADSFSHWFCAPLYYFVAFIATSSVGYLAINAVPYKCAFLEKLGCCSMSIYLSHLLLFMGIDFLVDKGDRISALIINSMGVVFSIIVFSSDWYRRFFDGSLTYIKNLCIKSL